MSWRTLGEHFDIHGGGMDLIFPHHENEIAQSEAAFGPPMARYWMHAGFLNVDSEKMSKSLGNFVTVRDVLARNDAEGLRYFYLGAHYRVPVNFDLEKRADGRVVFPLVDEAERRVEYLYTTKEALAAAAGDAPAELPAKLPPVLAPHAKIVEEARERVLSALDKDLNTPVALSVLAELAKAANEIAAQAAKLKKDPAAHGAARSLAAAALRAIDGACAPLGLLQTPGEAFAARTRERRLRIRGLDAGHIDAKVKERTEARAAKDFARGDAIRKELADMGVELLDAAGATSWKVTV
jgi:cysteinyl-tRNA synthetase